MRHLTSLSVVCACALVLPVGTALSNDIRTRAETAIAGQNTGGEIFTEDRAHDTSALFAAPEPPQAALTADTLEEATITTILSDTPVSNTFSNIESRPVMTLDPATPLLDPAKWASTDGARALGDLETGQARSCTYRTFGAAPPFQRTCERVQNISERRCAVVLELDPAGDMRNVNDCAAHESDPLCMATSLRCSAGPETRMIDGMAQTRLCWEWDQSYLCHAPDKISNCTPFETNAACTIQQTDCLAHDPNGNCSHESVLYACGNPEVRPDVACGQIEICEGDLCTGVPVTRDTSFADISTWLNVAHEAAEDNTLADITCDPGNVERLGSCPSSDVRFFTGTRQSCGVAALGVRNCCKNSGIVVSLLDNCSDAELEIQQGFAKKSTTYLGEYCARRFFGACLKRAKAFCTFQSKFARVFQEEARRISAVAWGSAKHEGCHGLSVDQVSALDFERMDLSELFPDALSGTNSIDGARLTDRLADRMAALIGANTAVPAPLDPDPNFNDQNVIMTTGTFVRPNPQFDGDRGLGNDVDRTLTVNVDVFSEDTDGTTPPDAYVAVPPAEYTPPLTTTLPQAEFDVVLRPAPTGPKGASR